MPKPGGKGKRADSGAIQTTAKLPRSAGTYARNLTIDETVALVDIDYAGKVSAKRAEYPSYYYSKFQSDGLIIADGNRYKLTTLGNDVIGVMR